MRLTLCAFGKLLVLQFREKHQDATARKGFALRPLGKTHCYSDFASNFEIISRNENYAFNHNNFYHNGNNRIWRLPRLLTKSRNDDFIVCNNGLLSLNNELFSRNDYGKDFIFGFWSNFNFGFLFNRKINSKKILFQKEKKR